MLRILGIIFLVLIVGFGGLLVWGYFNSGDSREMARDFVLRMSARDYEGVRALMHPELAATFTDERWEQTLQGMVPFTEVTFSSFDTEAGVGTTVGGTARADNGCESPVTFTFVNDQVTSFDITTICRE